MPTYDFRCGKCGTRFAQNLPIGTKSAPCTVCGSLADKIFSPPAISFQGSGFYSSDNKTKPKTPSAPVVKPVSDTPAPATKTDAHTVSTDKKEK